MTTSVETGLRALIAEVVREELDQREKGRAATDQYLSVGAAAEIASVAQRTIRRWLAEGKLTCHRVGTRVVRIRRAELEQLLRDGNRIDNDNLSPEALALRDFG